jgi:hypothetical protein
MPMPFDSLTQPDTMALDTLIIEHHNATHPEAIFQDGWTEDWVFRVLLAPRRVRASRQEAQALRNFARSQRA